MKDIKQTKSHFGISTAHRCTQAVLTANICCKFFSWFRFCLHSLLFPAHEPHKSRDDVIFLASSTLSFLFMCQNIGATNKTPLEMPRAIQFTRQHVINCARKYSLINHVSQCDFYCAKNLARGETIEQWGEAAASNHLPPTMRNCIMTRSGFQVHLDCTICAAHYVEKVRTTWCDFNWELHSECKTFFHPIRLLRCFFVDGDEIMGSINLVGYQHALASLASYEHIITIIILAVSRGNQESSYLIQLTSSVNYSHHEALRTISR